MPSNNSAYSREWGRKYRKDRLNKREGESTSALHMMAIRTQKEVADILGISRQAVHQAEREALWKIRHRMKPFMDSLRQTT